jgi:hypothetical protein
MNGASSGWAQAHLPFAPVSTGTKVRQVFPDAVQHERNKERLLSTAAASALVLHR